MSIGGRAPSSSSPFLYLSLQWSETWTRWSEFEVSKAEDINVFEQTGSLLWCKGAISDGRPGELLIKECPTLALITRYEHVNRGLTIAHFFC